MIGLIALTLVFSALLLISYLSERAIWNKGISRASGLPWHQFDTDSSNARGYTDGLGNYCWCSWNIEAANIGAKP